MKLKKFSNIKCCICRKSYNDKTFLTVPETTIDDEGLVYIRSDKGEPLYFKRYKLSKKKVSWFTEKLDFFCSPECSLKFNDLSK